jgi:uncharacterized membrane protein
MSLHDARAAGTEQDQQLELAIAMLLRAGVLLSAALVLVGGILALRHPGIHAPSYRAFAPPGAANSSALTSISGLFHHLRDGSGANVIGLGLLVLIATPIARVLFAMLGFARERDLLYTGISLLVLAILMFSLLHGH